MGLDDFDLEPSEHEPEEWDPEEDLHDPEAPGLTIPTVETAESDAPKAVVQTFWTIVLIVNVALFLVSVGPMLIYFEGWVREGTAMVVAGVVLFGLAYRRYRAFERAPPAETESSSSETPSPTPNSGEPHRSSDGETDRPDSINRPDSTDRPNSTDPSDIHEDSS